MGVNQSITAKLAQHQGRTHALAFRHLRGDLLNRAIDSLQGGAQFVTPYSFCSLTGFAERLREKHIDSQAARDLTGIGAAHAIQGLEDIVILAGGTDGTKSKTARMRFARGWMMSVSAPSTSPEGCRLTGRDVIWPKPFALIWARPRWWGCRPF